jgi:hypothetical protein
MLFLKIMNLRGGSFHKYNKWSRPGLSNEHKEKIMKPMQIILIGLVILVCTIYAPAFSEVPNYINYQGRLTDSLGVNVPDGLYDIMFSIYNDPSTPTHLWQEPQVIEVNAGLFNAQLGIAVLFGELFFANGPDLYLGIKVGADPELAPRVKISSSVFSIYSQVADEAHVAHSIAENTVTDMNIVDGSIGFYDIGQNGAGEGQVMKWLGGNWIPSDDEAGTGVDSDWVISGTDMYSGVEGNVGIGTPSPSAKLDVDFASTGSLKIGTPLGTGPGLIMFAPNGNRRDFVAGDWGLSLGASASSGAVDQNRFVIRENGTIDIKGSNLSSGDAILDVAYDSSNTSSLYAIRGYSNPQDGYGVGGSFQGGMTGVAGEVAPTGSGIYTGVFGRVIGGSGTNEAGNFNAWNGISNTGLYSRGTGGTWAYGLYSTADNSDTCYGIYASAANGDLNYGVYGTTYGAGSCAGYFEASGLSTHDAVLKAVYADTNQTYHMRAIEGVCKPHDYIGTGGYFVGGRIGVDALVEPIDQWTYIGMNSHVDGGTGSNYAISGLAEEGDVNFGCISIGRYGLVNVGTYGAANNGDSCYGVYASASGGDSVSIGVYSETTSSRDDSHAGYFASNGLGAGGQVLKAEYEGGDLNDAIAIEGVSKPADFYGIGGSFEGGYIGAKGKVFGSGTNTYIGLLGTSTGNSSGTNIGVFGTATTASTNYAGYFEGDVNITGSTIKSGGITKIDHPLDPDNMYLSHRTVESPEMKTVYDGTVVLNSDGDAVVQLPEYFEALNRDFRYQLTCIGGYAPVYIADEISNNEFMIAGGKSGMKVSWQVTGIRNDAYANSKPIEVETYKSDKDRGSYLNPKAFGLSSEYGISPMNSGEQKLQSSEIENNPGSFEEMDPRVQKFLEEQEERNNR